MDDLGYVEALARIQDRYRNIQTAFSTIGNGPDRVTELTKARRGMDRLNTDLAALHSPESLLELHESWVRVLQLMAASLTLFELGDSGIEPLRQAHQEARRSGRIIKDLPQELEREVTQVLYPQRAKPDA